MKGNREMDLRPPIQEQLNKIERCHHALGDVVRPEDPTSYDEAVKEISHLCLALVNKKKDDERLEKLDLQGRVPQIKDRDFCKGCGKVEVPCWRTKYCPTCKAKVKEWEKERATAKRKGIKFNTPHPFPGVYDPKPVVTRTCIKCKDEFETTRPKICTLCPTCKGTVPKNISTTKLCNLKGCEECVTGDSLYCSDAHANIGRSENSNVRFGKITPEESRLKVCTSTGPETLASPVTVAPVQILSAEDAFEQTKQVCQRNAVSMVEKITKQIVVCIEQMEFSVEIPYSDIWQSQQKIPQKLVETVVAILEDNNYNVLAGNGVILVDWELNQTLTDDVQLSPVESETPSGQ